MPPKLLLLREVISCFSDNVIKAGPQEAIKLSVHHDVLFLSPGVIFKYFHGLFSKKGPRGLPG